MEHRDVVSFVSEDRQDDRLDCDDARGLVELGARQDPPCRLSQALGQLALAEQKPANWAERWRRSTFRGAPPRPAAACGLASAINNQSVIRGGKATGFSILAAKPAIDAEKAQRDAGEIATQV